MTQSRDPFEGGNSSLLKKNYYLTLGGRMAEHGNGLRHAFCELVKHYHPDSVGANGTPFFQEIVEAYRFLSDSDRRENYTRGLSHAGAFTDSATALPLPDLDSRPEPALPAPARFLSHPLVSWPSLELVRERVLRNFLHAEPPEQVRTEAIDIQVSLTPEDTATGGIVMIEAPGYYPCALCRGAGQVGGFPCRVCDELGVVEEKEMIPVAIPSMLGSYQQMEIPLRGLGIHNFYLRLHFNVVPQ